MPCVGENSQNPGPLPLLLVMAGHQASGPVQVCQEISSGADRREQIPGKAEGAERCPSGTNPAPSSHRGGQGRGGITDGVPSLAQGGTPLGAPGRDGDLVLRHAGSRRRWLGHVCPALSSAPGRSPNRESIKVALFWDGRPTGPVKRCIHSTGSRP